MTACGLLSSISWFPKKGSGVHGPRLFPPICILHFAIFNPKYPARTMTDTPEKQVSLSDFQASHPPHVS